MNNRMTLLGRNSLSKLTLFLILLTGGGNLAVADTVIVDGSTITSDWTNGGAKHSKSTLAASAFIQDTDNNQLTPATTTYGIGYNTYSWYSLSSKETITITTGQKIVMSVKGLNNNSCELLIRTSSDGTTFTDTKDITTDIRNNYNNYTELTFDDIVGTYYIQVVGIALMINSICIVDTEDVTTPVLSVTPNNYAFGDVTSNSTTEITVSNAGIGQMSVNISSDNDEFTVSPTSLTDIENGSPQTFTITFNHSTERLGDRSATITVTPTHEGGTSVAITVTASAVDPNAVDVTLDENNATTWTASYTGTKKILLKYTAYNGWNTFCVPFSPSSYMNNIFGNGWTAYTLKSYENGVITFAKATTLTAGTPYLVYVENAATHTSGVLFETTSIYSPTGANKATQGGATFQGTYAPVSMEGKYGVTGSGTIQKGGAGSNIPGYRAYFTGVSEAANGARPAIVFSEEEMPTGIGAVQLLENTQDVYNLNGQKVSQTHKGIYIVNGRKIVVK